MENYKEFDILVDIIRKYQKQLYSYDRVNLWNELYQGYCPKCGDPKKDRTCTCERDE